MRIQFRLAAGEHERFTEQFARSLIGKTPRLNARAYEGGPVIAEFGIATVVAAEVVEDGRAVLITYDSPLDIGAMFWDQPEGGGEADDER